MLLLLGALYNYYLDMLSKKVPKFGLKESKRWCSTVMCCSWMLIVMWVVFLLYCWKSGLVDQKKITDLVAETETSLLNRMHYDTGKSGHSAGAQPDKNNNSGGESAILVAKEPVAVPKGNGEMHVVFSTDCSPYQDWQTLLLFHSAKVVGQQGKITRIASGCTDEQKNTLNALYKTLYPEYGAHFTPDFKKDAKTNKKCECAVVSTARIGYI